MSQEHQGWTVALALVAIVYFFAFWRGKKKPH
jgi:hypothetical protein